MVIRHLPHNSIDKKKWDDFISKANNGLIYAKSWYLDVVSPQWEALISNDFKYVMPVPLKRKYKIPYIVQPYLTQQLGVFSNEPITEEIIRKFIQKLPSYSYQLNLNACNFLPDANPFPNYILPLDNPYEILVKAYSKNTARNIDKATKSKLNIIEHYNLDGFITFYQSISRKYKPTNCECMRALIANGLQQGVFKLKAVTNEEGEIIAALCYTAFKNRLTYLIPVSNEKGKKESAMFYLVDTIIRQESGKDKMLDFEGSSIDGVARFYKGFGAKNHPYYVIKNLRPSFLVGRIK
ncbi:MAG: hypothetical protein PHQ11_03540 [Paludibacter sp.]|nr:hypothetical protein [Paludibacter sp.]MDD4197886.1 hypothetical protein [Paludibacter sp.]MDD4427561.1 hypothetical protein [Paludibacter sp.]